MKQSSKLLAHC